ncbi:hypothetical protein [Streptomyces tagetis]|uniref:Immunity protein Imm1 n=1 Tax=Streptomyces tagetis TaxID=2820809 RepID=A0A940XEI5_9ACTN|nr:hypothetical protein [Streptomyces sp. RG38]MBQ0825692.1 hypothetical protein [Streptomyces sp. RG38]
MSESWVIEEDGPATVPSGAVRDVLRARIARGRLETWLTGSSGRSLAVVTNTERAMVVLLAREGDPGEHAVDPGAEGWSDGYVLANGQDDEYPDEDTIPLDEAFRIVEHLVGEGAWPADARWVSDR